MHITGGGGGTILVHESFIVTHRITSINRSNDFHLTNNTLLLPATDHHMHGHTPHSALARSVNVAIYTCTAIIVASRVSCDVRKNNRTIATHMMQLCRHMITRKCLRDQHDDVDNDSAVVATAYRYVGYGAKRLIHQYWKSHAR